MLLKSQNGSALVNAMMAAALSIIVAYTVMTTKSDQIKVVTSMNAPISAQIVKARVIATLMSEKAITNTVACQTGNCPKPSGTASGTGLALYDDIGAGQLILDTKYPNSGFAISGDACDTFDAVNGNDECPFRYELAGTMTTGPTTINVTGVFKFKPKSSWVMNTSNYDFTYNNTTGGSEVRNISETCKAFGNGTIIGANLEANKASCSTFIMSCGGAGVVMGPNGLPICNPTAINVNCTGSQKFMGYNSSTGAAICQ